MNDAHDNAQTDREALERHGATLTHAVTAPQPLAWAIAAGHCPVLMSDTRPDMRHEGTLIGIHAGLGSRRAHASATMERWVSVMGPLDVAVPADLPTGALIGVARLVGVVRAGMISGQFQRMAGRAVSDSMPAELNARIRTWWRSGSKWGLLLAEAVLLPEPIPMRGAGGVWRIQDREMTCAELHRPSYDAELTLQPMLTAWALEQWRKARGAA